MRICLVCNEILGAHRNGGIGTATSHLAILLAQNGHSVTLFYTGSAALEPISPWVSYYRTANVTVCHFPRSTAQISPPWMQQPVAIYEQLQCKSFDVILFQDWMALGHACLLAKRASLAFGRTTLAVIAHSSTPWILEANQLFPRSPADLALFHMEQQSIELADSVVSPSHYLKNWMDHKDWKLPRNTSVIPYFLGGPELLGAKQPSMPARRKRMSKPPHLVFLAVGRRARVSISSFRPSPPTS